MLLHNLQYILLYVQPDSRSDECFWATTALFSRKFLLFLYPFKQTLPRSFHIFYQTASKKSQFFSTYFFYVLDTLETNHNAGGNCFEFKKNKLLSTE